MRLVMLGAPGVGKGTLAQRLAQELQLKTVATGDVLRNAIKEKTTLGNRVSSLVNSGQLVPDKLIAKIVEECLQEPAFSQGYILDGFPRTLVQAEALREFSEPDCVLSLKATSETILKRLASRLVCSGCGATYNLEFTPPHKEGICDRCNAQLERRKDDDAKVAIERLRLYEEQSKPLFDYYQQHRLIIDVDALATPDTVFQNALKALGNFHRQN